MRVSFIQWLCGYGKVEFKGMGTERALNFLDQNGIALWQIRRQDRLTVTACVPLSQKKACLRLADRLPCRFAWQKSCGVPGVVYRLFRRRALMAGLALLVVGSVVSVQFVWRVEITGAEGELAQKLYQLAEENGYGPGAFWGHMRLNEIERVLLLQLPEAAGLLANRTGTTLSLEIIPAVPAPELFAPGAPCDIVAAEDGVVQSITALEGVAKVKQGQTVKKGEVLISGVIEREEGPARTVEARGEVKATVSVLGSHTVPMTSETPTPVGPVYTTRLLQLGSWQVPLEKAPSDRDAMLMNTTVQLLCSVYLPARVITQTWQPISLEKQPRPFAEAEAAAAETAVKNAKAQLKPGEEAESVVLQTRLSEDGAAMTVYAIVQTTRSIGEKGAQTLPTPAPQS